jgi:hypothetical protein
MIVHGEAGCVRATKVILEMLVKKETEHWLTCELRVKEWSKEWRVAA